MNWTADEVRQLRYRLGWSQAEMARCLKLDLSVVSSVEAGRVPLPNDLRNAMIRILNQAETNAERVHRSPIAEVMMRDRGLSQIRDFEVAQSLDKTKDSPTEN